jgi:hypothetical protein
MVVAPCELSFSGGVFKFHIWHWVPEVSSSSPAFEVNHKLCDGHKCLISYETLSPFSFVLD